MACYHPILAVSRGPGLKPRILPRRVDMNFEQLKDKYGDDLLRLPCGHCLGCSLDYSKQWSVRIMLEATLHKYNSFITLTFDDDNYSGFPGKRPFQLFMKRLRKYFNWFNVRFFACCEAGSETHRWHYHAILFGVDFEDKVLLKKTEAGELIYTSNILTKLWPFGISSIGEVTSASASYVARYSMKKKMDGIDDGSFVLMSRRPGLGIGAFNKQWFASSKIYTSDGFVTVPRFFQNMMEKFDSDFFNEWKESRKEFNYPDKRYIFQVENEEEALQRLEGNRLNRYAVLRGL